MLALANRECQGSAQQIPSLGTSQLWGPRDGFQGQLPIPSPPFPSPKLSSHPVCPQRFRTMTADTSPPPNVFVVSSAFPDGASAETAAQALIEERLAACVQLLPGAKSFYRWQGRLHASAEALLLAKTAADRVEALIARLAALHPYELPEIVAVQAEAGFPAYAAWVRAETREILQETRPA